MKAHRTFGVVHVLVILLSAGASLGSASEQPANTCPSWGIPIHVHIHGIRNAHGSVKVVLYGPDPETFLVKGKKADKEREPAQENLMTLCVAAPSEGKYVVVVYHDENDNHKFDRNWIGLPVEGFGVSKNPTMFFTPPSFEEAAFDVNGDITNIEVEIKY